jgi:hypothetical protein
MTEQEEMPAGVEDPTTPPGSGFGRKRGRRLYSITNVRAALADVIRRLDSNEIELPRARVMIYGLSSLAAIIKDSDLEARIATLEGKKA